MGWLAELYERRKGSIADLHGKHLNRQLVRVLSTIGFPHTYARGEGHWLYDEQGNRYLDLLSGFGTFNLGRNHPGVAAALAEAIQMQLPNLVQMSCDPLAGMLAEDLLTIAPDGLDHVMFANSGAEAVEGAIKMARCATEREGIICCEGAFHGLTTGALALNGHESFRKGFGSLLPSVHRVNFGELEPLEALLSTREHAAFVFEPIQGKGVVIPPPDYLPEAARLCKKYGTLLVADEIQTGLGRTGSWFAVEHWGVNPDMVLIAKGLSGGYVPVGAILHRAWINKKLFGSMERCMVHGSTFARNDLAMVAGLATLKFLKEEGLVERSRTSGARLVEGLAELATRHRSIRQVRGIGLMVGLEFGPPQGLVSRMSWGLFQATRKGLFAQAVVMALMKDHRILSQVAGDEMEVIKFIPPLTVGEEEVKMLLEALDSVLQRGQGYLGTLWNMARGAVSGV